MERPSTTTDFIDHCEPPCGLGRLEYRCPVCNKEVTDLGAAAVAMAEERIYFPFETECPECKAIITLTGYR